MFENGTHFQTTWNRLKIVFQILILVGDKGHVQTVLIILSNWTNFVQFVVWFVLFADFVWDHVFSSYKRSKNTLFVPSLLHLVCAFVFVVTSAFHGPFERDLQERNKREIRHRTNVRLAQLQLEQDNRQSSSQDEQEQETDSLTPSPTVSQLHCRSISALSTLRSLCLHISLWFVLFVLVCFFFDSFTFPFLMKPSKYTPFKAPRTVPQPVVPPRRTGHRKDNAEWGKRMEKELGQIEKRQGSEPKKVTPLKVPLHLRMMSEREADEMSRHGEVQRWSSDSDSDETLINR